MGEPTRLRVFRASFEPSTPLPHGPGHPHGTAQGQVLGSPGPGRPSPPAPALAVRPRPGPASQTPGSSCGRHRLDPISREPRAPGPAPLAVLQTRLSERCFTFFEVGVDSRSLVHTKSHSQSRLRGAVTAMAIHTTRNKVGPAMSPPAAPSPEPHTARPSGGAAVHTALRTWRRPAVWGGGAPARGGAGLSGALSPGAAACSPPRPVPLLRVRTMACAARCGCCCVTAHGGWGGVGATGCPRPF